MRLDPRWPRLKFGFGDDGSWDSPCAQPQVAALIPAPPPLWHPACAVACDGTWMRIRPSRGSGRRPEGRADGWLEIREASVSNGAEPATALAAQGAMARKRRKPKLCPGTEIAGAGAARQPTEPFKVPGSSARGSQGGLARPPGAGWYRPPGCRRGTRVPVAPPARMPGTDGACVVGGKRDVVNRDCLRCRTGHTASRGSTGSPRGWRKRAARSYLVLSLSKDVNGCTGKLWFGGACC